MPYLYATAITAHTTGTPMMRPLFFEFPEDKTSWTIDEAYMLGENLYVAPVFSGSDSDSIDSGGYSAAGSSFAPENSTNDTQTGSSEKDKTQQGDTPASVQVYIPPGDWFSLLTGDFYTGPSWSTQRHSYSSIPLLLRPGRAIVLSGGAPVDFYFDASGAWKLRELDEVKEEERARKGDGEWRARGAEYDCTSKVTVLVNTSRSPPPGSDDEQMGVLDLRVYIPDSHGDRLGQVSAELRVREIDGGKVRVEVVHGDLRGEWKVLRVGKETGVAQGVASGGQKSLEV